MSTTLAYPPPLSAAPTVETLERLLSGLQRPVERCVPTPPVIDLAAERLFEGVTRPVVDSTRGLPAPVSTPRPAATWSAGLTWSAGNAQSTLPYPLSTFSSATTAAAAAAAAALAALLSRPDLVGLP